MIVGYRDKRSREFGAGQRVKAFSGIERSARMKLDRLEAATSLKDLAALPGNRFEALSGDRKGQYSIRINDQWRVCFEWPEGAAGEIHGTICDSSGRSARRRTEGARHERRGARASATGADKPRHGDPEWPARYHGRQRAAPR